MADRADMHVTPDGELVKVDLSATDGEGTVCLENEARWYIAQGLTTKPQDTGDALTKDDVYGVGSTL